MTPAWTGCPELALLAEKEEDRFTQYLCELLRSESVMAAFLRTCGVIPPEAAPTLQPSTQATIPNGRLDLAIRGPGYYLLFEAKVSSWLHDEQLVPYAADLHMWKGKNLNGQCCLILLAPAATLSGIGETAAGQLEKAGFAERPTLVAWEQVASMCRTLIDVAQPADLRVHLATFAALVDRRLGQAHEPFSSEEVSLLASPLTGRAVHRASVLLRKLVESLQKVGPELNLSITSAHSKHWQGHNLYVGDRWWWVGMWPPVWSTVGGSPLVLQVPGMTEDLISSVPKRLPRPVRFHLSNGEGFVVHHRPADQWRPSAQPRGPRHGIIQVHGLPPGEAKARADKPGSNSKEKRETRP